MHECYSAVAYCEARQLLQLQQHSLTSLLHCVYIHAMVLSNRDRTSEFIDLATNLSGSFGLPSNSQQSTSNIGTANKNSIFNDVAVRLSRDIHVYNEKLHTLNKCMFYSLCAAFFAPVHTD